MAAAQDQTNTFYAPDMDPHYDDYDSAFENFLAWAEQMDAES